MDPIDWKPKIQGRKRKEINLLFHTARDMYHLERVDPDVIPPLVARAMGWDLVAGALRSLKKRPPLTEWDMSNYRLVFCKPCCLTLSNLLNY